MNLKQLFRTRLKRNDSSDSAAVAEIIEQAEQLKPASLKRSRLLLMIGATGMLACVAYAIFQVMLLQVLVAREQENRATASMVVAALGTVAAGYRQQLAGISADPEVARVLKYGTAGQREIRAESMQAFFPGVIGISLLQPGIDQVDSQASPPLSYAGLAQLRSAEQKSEITTVEVHALNQPAQHVSVVAPVLDPAGSGVVGTIRLSLQTSIVKSALNGLQQIPGYVEILQDGDRGAPAVIAKKGAADLKSDSPALLMSIPATGWQVAYWPPVGAAGYAATAGVRVLGLVLFCALILLSLIWLQFRRLANAVRIDEASMITLMKDLREGYVDSSYRNGLAELRDALQYIIQLATGVRDRVKSVRPVPREQDKDASPLQMSDALADAAVRTMPYVPDESLFVADVVDEPVDNLPVQEPQLSTSDSENKPLDASIFRAYDIRGVVDKSLTVPTVRLIGQAIGSEALQRGRNTVVVGRDGRLSGPKLVQALIEGITATGCNVKDIGCVPTPVLYFATYFLETHTGVVVTGSHNPPDYNGLKIVIDGETLSGESIQELRERIEAQNFISGQGEVETLDVLPDYLQRITGDVKLKRPLRVAIDCGNGVAGNVAPQLFRALGCDVTELYCEVDGTFPNHHPDPSKSENLQDLIGAVISGDIDVGLAFDGDGDRLGVVASNGSVIWPDRVLMLFAMDILDRNPGGQIIYDVKCTRFLDGIIREHGGEPLMWKTGHSFIKAKIRESGALLAGEMSGHIFINERWYGFDDGIYAGARLLEILSAEERSSQEIFAALPDSVNTPEINIAMQEGQPPRFISKLLEIADFGDARVSTIDGMRVDFPDGWGLVRASNTTPVLVLRFEADDAAALERIMTLFRTFMLQVQPDLQLTF